MRSVCSTTEKRWLLDQVDPRCRSYLVEHGVHAGVICPNCDSQLLAGVSIMPWRAEDVYTNMAQQEESSPTSAKKRRTKEDSTSGTARVSLDEVSINQLGEGRYRYTNIIHQKNQANSDDDDDGRSVSLFI